MPKTDGNELPPGCTTGPWVVIPGTARVLAGTAEHNYSWTGWPIAWPAKGGDRAEALANAYLVAAAPELYAALRELLADLADAEEDHSIQRAQQALEKAHAPKRRPKHIRPAAQEPAE
jgi:hypothetical protein